ncbi:hypothetical protein NL676_009121 [Syzygium grande]|nr:hypothetical protein NL676_009121 [Syzygium grande]
MAGRGRPRRLLPHTLSLSLSKLSDLPPFPPPKSDSDPCAPLPIPRAAAALLILRRRSSTTYLWAEMGKGGSGSGSLSEGVVKKILLSYTYVAVWIFLSFTVIVYNKYILDRKLYN